jgi:hypothetical protein
MKQASLETRPVRRFSGQPINISIEERQRKIISV